MGKLIGGWLRLLTVIPWLLPIVGYALSGLMSMFRRWRDDRLSRQLSAALLKAKATKDTSDVENLFR